MSVLDRDALSGSPLADLHVIAGEIGLDGFRRLRKDDLVDAILARQGGEESAPARGEASSAVADEAPAAPVAGGEDDDEAPKPRRRRRGGRGRRGGAAGEGEGEGAGDETAAAVAAGDRADAEEEPDEDEAPPSRRRRGGRNRPTEDGADQQAVSAPPDAATGGGDEPVEGTIEVLANGSAFVRISPPDPSDADVYVSAAQVRRCELVSGDRVMGPVRPPRRSERYPSLVRVETINGQPADEAAERTRWDDLPAAFPSERIKLASEDETLKALEFLTPFGRGSRVVIAGPPRAGKSEALRRLAAALAAQEGLEVSAVLTGVRPEEVAEWESGSVAVTASTTFAASPDAQAQALERGVDQAKRVAARGGHAVLLVDALDGLAPGAARKALAAARAIPEAGSLTIVATALVPPGGETTVISLDVALTSTGRFPALDLAQSGTLRPELLVGETGAEAIARARAEALGL